MFDFPENLSLEPYEFDDTYLADEDGTHYTRTDTLPRWRTVGVDGMPEEGTRCLIALNGDMGSVFVGVAARGGWQRRTFTDAYPADRYIPLSELARLPGGRSE